MDFPLINSDESRVIDMASEDITIVAGTKHSYPLKVERENCMLQWEFVVNGYDIKFGIAKMRQENTKEEMEFILPLETYAPDLFHEGKVALDTPGQYILLWDNSNSWLREKTIHYHLQMTRGQATRESLMGYSK